MQHILVTCYRFVSSIVAGVCEVWANGCWSEPDHDVPGIRGNPMICWGEEWRHGRGFPAGSAADVLSILNDAPGIICKTERETSI